MMLADGRVPCREALSVLREGRPPAGLSVCLLEEALALLQLQEAIPVHLLPPGWRAAAQGSLLFLFCPAVGEGSG